jgi:hypothetical protein
MGEWSIDGTVIGRRKPQYSENNLPQCHFVDHISHYIIIIIIIVVKKPKIDLRCAQNGLTKFTENRLQAARPGLRG